MYGNNGRAMFLPELGTSFLRDSLKLKSKMFHKDAHLRDLRGKGIKTCKRFCPLL